MYRAFYFTSTLYMRSPKRPAEGALSGGIKNNTEGKLIDIRNYPEVVDIINTALNEKRVIEVKNEARKEGVVNIVVVGLGREVLTKPKNRNEK